jgi:hypothetical protein
VRRILLLFTVLSGLVPGYSQSGRQEQPLRLHNETGWEVPFLQQIVQRTPKSQGTSGSGGGAYEYKRFALSPADRRPVASYRVLFLSHKDNTDYVSWHNLEPRNVIVYSVRNRTFALLVEGVIRMGPEPDTGQGGTGGEVRVAYQDVDGSGKFKLLLENLPSDFRPEVPGWTKK